MPPSLFKTANAANALFCNKNRRRSPHRARCVTVCRRGQAIPPLRCAWAAVVARPAAVTLPKVSRTLHPVLHVGVTKSDGRSETFGSCHSVISYNILGLYLQLAVCQVSERVSSSHAIFV